MKCKGYILAGTALLSGLYLPHQAMAQANTLQADDQNDIIVTAQRREQSLQDTPIAVTAFSNSMMDDRSITSDDLGRKLINRVELPLLA